MSTENYARFRTGLEAGLADLWQPWFMSGVRNGGFEQTLRNVCLPHIERALGKMAFTESRGRADLLLCGEEEDGGTRCEFKVNFALQLGEIRKRKRDALNQIRKPTAYKAQDGIVVYAVAELIHKGKALSVPARRHNMHVASTPYKLFRDRGASGHSIAAVRERMETPSEDKFGLIPGFNPLFEQEGICFDWDENCATLHVWTHHEMLPER